MTSRSANKSMKAALPILLIALVLLAAPAYAQTETPLPIPGQADPGGGTTPWDKTTLKQLGLTGALQQYDTQPTLTFWFFTRADQVLNRARLRLTFFDKEPELWAGFDQLEVLVNGEPIAQLERDAVLAEPKVSISIDSRLLLSENSITFRLNVDNTGLCGRRVALGTWRLIKHGVLETKGAPLPLQSDLSLLPIPFVDPRYDKNPVVHFIFAKEPSSEDLRAAGLAAGYFGLLAGSGVRFEVHVNDIPPVSAVVIANGPLTLGNTELPTQSRATLSMVDHPASPGSNLKLLVLSGPNHEAPVQAALALALMELPLQGTTLDVGDVRTPAPRALYDAPRWLPAEPIVQFGQIKGGKNLTHRGLVGGTLPLDFRISPDLFAWPDEFVHITVDYSHIAPNDDFVPQVTVELNHTYVGTLDPPKVIEGVATGSKDLVLHRSRLRGFNSLQFHVGWPNLDRVCDVEPSYVEALETTIAPSSAIHFDEIPHFIRMPNVAVFVDDGYPFTRYADLGETAVVLPSKPTPGEIGTALSMMAHFAAITGVPATRVAFTNPAGIDRNADKDLLIVGAAENLAFLHSWPGYQPLSFPLGQVAVNRPSTGMQTKALFGGRLTWRNIERAQRKISRTSNLAVVAGFESPYAHGRSATLVSASSTQTMPFAGDLIGFTEAKNPGGDLLVTGVGGRWRFGIGPEYDVGEVAPFTRLRWAGTNHWLILLPSLILAAFVLATISRTGLQRRAWKRLHPEDDE
jgi:cellulose synthase operon protein B